MSNAPEPGMTGSRCSTTSSTSSSAERYHLDEFDERPMMVFKPHAKIRTELMRYMSQKDLCSMLDKDSKKFRASRVNIPRFTSFVEIKHHDTLLPEEKEFSPAKYLNGSIAGIVIPWKAYLGRALFGSYDNMFVLTPESSPSTSPTSSVSSSVGQLEGSTSA